MQKIKVLKVGKFYPPFIGGVEKVMGDIVGLLKNEIDFTVLVSQIKGKTQKETIHSIPVHRLWSMGVIRSTPIAPSFLWQLPRHIHQNDIVHFHFPYPVAEASYVLTCSKHIPSIVWWHSDIVRQKLLLKLYKPFLKRFLDRVDLIITASPNHIDHSDYLLQYKEKTRVIPFGINPRDFELNDQDQTNLNALRKKIEWKHTVLFVGRLIYYKGVEYLITAMQFVDKETGLIIIGDGILHKEIQHLIEEYKLSDRVKILSSLEWNQLKIYYHLCDIFVLPSIERSEAFGLVQLEAMACKKPVINTNIPSGVPYVSKDKETGLTVPVKNAEKLASAINQLINDNDLRNQFGENAFKRVQSHFTLDQFKSNLLDAYQSVL